MSGELPVAKELRSEELSETISGQSFVAFDVKCADCGFDETFSKSGAWRGVLYGLGPIPVEGEWRIDGNRVCVLAQSARLRICRRMRRDAAGDLHLPSYRFFAADLSSDDAVRRASSIKSTWLFKVRAT